MVYYPRKAGNAGLFFQIDIRMMKDTVKYYFSRQGKIPNTAKCSSLEVYGQNTGSIHEGNKSKQYDVIKIQLGIAIDLSKRYTVSYILASMCDIIT